MPRRFRFLPFVLFFVLATLALLPALRHGSLFSNRYDFRYFDSMAEVARRTVVYFHQAPLWNPYSCGGEVDLANPQSLDGAPTFLFTLLFGTAWGVKLSFLLYYLLALLGMYTLARRLALSVTPSLLAAVAFGLSGYLAAHVAAGHTNFASVALFPYLIYCFDRALSRLRWVIPMGALAAWVAVYGGTFTPALGGELLVLWAIFAAVCPRDDAPSEASVGKRLLRAFLVLLFGGLVALLLGAYRMLPALEFVFYHPRSLYRRAPDMTVAWRLFGDLFSWRDYAPILGRKYWSHEYTARLPVITAPFIALSLALAIVRRELRRSVGTIAILSTVAALLCLGNYSEFAPWSLLQKLPVLRDLRVPSRHLVLLVFFLALLAGIGLESLKSWLLVRAPRLAAWPLCAIVAVAAIDGVFFTNANFRGVFDRRILSPDPLPPFYIEEGHWSVMRELIFQGHGVMRCDEEAPLQRARTLDIGPAYRTGTPAAAKLSDPSGGTVIEHAFTPNSHTVTVDLLNPESLLILNSNWNEHFHIKRPAEGAKVVATDGRLAVELRGLAPGRHVIEVVYAPRSFTVGALLSLFSWPLLLFLFFYGLQGKLSSAERQSGAHDGPLGRDSV